MDSTEAKRADVTIRMLHAALEKTTEANAELAKANAALHAEISQVKEELRRKGEELQRLKSDNARPVAVRQRNVTRVPAVTAQPISFSRPPSVAKPSGSAPKAEPAVPSKPTGGFAAFMAKANAGYA